MPEIIETTVYQLHELSEAAKDKARGWYREIGFDFDWYDAVYEDFERICAIMGVSLATRHVRLFGGSVRAKPCIWFSGFWSQGDGAQKLPRSKFVPTRRRMPNFIGSPTASWPCSGATSISVMPRSRIGAATTTNTAWPFPSSAIARTART